MVTVFVILIGRVTHVMSMRSVAILDARSVMDLLRVIVTSAWRTRVEMIIIFVSVISFGQAMTAAYMQAHATQFAMDAMAQRHMHASSALRMLTETTVQCAFAITSGQEMTARHMSAFVIRVAMGVQDLQQGTAMSAAPTHTLKITGVSVVTTGAEARAMSGKANVTLNA